MVRLHGNSGLDQGSPDFLGNVRSQSSQRDTDITARRRCGTTYLARTTQLIVPPEECRQATWWSTVSGGRGHLG